jgi:hypothetical protein
LSATTTRRPIGATVLALALGWLAIGGFGNALVWRAAGASLQMPESSPLARFIEAASSPLFTGIALAYGATAMIACIAIWRMRPWMTTAFAVWGTAVTLTGVWLVTAMPSELLAGGVFVGLVFVVGCVGLLWVGYRYVRRIAPRGAL